MEDRGGDFAFVAGADQGIVPAPAFEHVGRGVVDAHEPVPVADEFPEGGLLGRQGARQARASMGRDARMDYLGTVTWIT